MARDHANLGCVRQGPLNGGLNAVREEPGPVPPATGSVTVRPTRSHRRSTRRCHDRDCFAANRIGWLLTIRTASGPSASRLGRITHTPSGGAPGSEGGPGPWGAMSSDAPRRQASQRRRGRARPDDRRRRRRKLVPPDLQAFSAGRSVSAESRRFGTLGTQPARSTRWAGPSSGPGGRASGDCPQPRRLRGARARCAAEPSTGRLGPAGLQCRVPGGPLLSGERDRLQAAAAPPTAPRAPATGDSEKRRPARLRSGLSARAAETSLSGVSHRHQAGIPSGAQGCHGRAPWRRAAFCREPGSISAHCQAAPRPPPLPARAGG